MDKAELDELEKTLSKNRLDYWAGPANGDREKALLLHRRNTLMAAVLYADLQVLEIALRNAVDRELQEQYGRDWLNQASFNVPPVRRAKKLAREIHGGLASRHDKILICLGFGFWVRECKDRGRRFMSGAFRSGTDLDETIKGLEQLLELRNAMVHHEPILDGTRPGKTLDADLKMLHSILESISPTAATWLDQTSWIRPLVRRNLASCTALESHELQIHVP